MAVERRRVLRNLCGATAAGAAGSLLGACSGTTAAPPEQPGTTSPSPAARRAAPTSAASPGAASPAVLPPHLPDQVRHGPRDRPNVALTFHGQGEPALAEAVLTTAERAGARLTVLAVGTWLDAHPGIARRILSGGHDLGNHTQHHVDISAMSAPDAYREIDDCARRLRRLTGSAGTWFRPSRAVLATPLVQRQARKAGYAHCLSYDVDSLDYTDPGADTVRRTVLAAVRPGSVVSMHLGHAGTLEALPGILDGLRGRGLSAVTATRMVRA